MAIAVGLMAAAGGAAAQRNATATPRPLHGTFAYSTHSGDLWVIDADGSHRRQLTHSGSGFDYKPTWSPDGEKIAFQTTRGKRPPDGETNIFVVDVGGGGERQLTMPDHFRYGGSSPDWSPTGTSIAFGSTRGLALVSPSGGAVRLVGFRGDAPSWSPDGSRLATVATTGTADAPHNAIYVVSPQGRGARRLTRDRANDFTGPWSPNGTKLAYLVQSRGTGHTYVMRSDGSSPTQVTHAAGTQFTSAWLSDGRLLVGVSKPRQRTPTWYLMRTDGSHAQPLPQLKDAISVAWHPETRQPKIGGA